jgi:hypothetical protein
VRQYVDLDGEVDVDELDDEQLLACVEEARRRGLLDGPLISKDTREIVVTAYQDILRGRGHKAVEGIELALVEGREELMDGWRAAREGRWNDAICHLDKVIDPQAFRKSAKAR